MMDTGPEKRNSRIENWLDSAQDLASGEVDPQLRSAGFDVEGLESRLSSRIAQAKAESRRRRARESYESAVGLLDRFRKGLRGDALRAAIEELRTSLEPQAQIWQVAAYRSLKLGEAEANQAGASSVGESPEPPSFSEDENAILEDLLALAELARTYDEAAITEVDPDGDGV